MAKRNYKDEAKYKLDKWLEEHPLPDWDGPIEEDIYGRSETSDKVSVEQGD